MREDQIDDIELRLMAAETEWSAFCGDDGRPFIAKDAKGQARKACIAAQIPGVNPDQVDLNAVKDRLLMFTASDLATTEDVEFVVSAPKDIQRLLHAVRRLTKKVDSLKVSNKSLSKDLDGHKTAVAISERARARMNAAFLTLSEGGAR